MRKLFFAATAALTLAACASSDPVDTAGASTFGHAANSNYAAQVSHTPASAEAPQGAGSQGALAQQRYNTGQTKPLLPSNTTATGNSSSRR